MAEYKKISFLDDFELPDITHELVKQQLSRAGKLKSVSKKTPLDNMPLDDRLNYISTEVNKTLGRYKGFVKTIRDEEEFNNYISFAIEEGILTLDTETNNSLDPLTCKLMGLCLYVPDTKPVYVPVSHTKKNKDILLEDQVSLQCITEAFKKLLASDIKIIYHNGKFDIRVCFNTTGVRLPIWWDTMIAAQLLDENELAGLKYQYKNHVDPTIGSYNIEKLFTGLPYAWIDPEVFALYSAIDAYDTYVLQQKQQEIMLRDDMKKLYRLFREIEVPVVRVVSEMEDNGITLDLEYLGRLSSIYKEKREECISELNNALTTYKDKLRYYTERGDLDDPINFDSPSQLCIILYDVLKTPAAENGRSTDKETLEKLDTSFTRLVLKYRHYTKMISGFTEAWPECVSAKDGKVHASFNQMGREENNVRTGRFSSSNPNLQQIPSHEGILRMAFKASVEYNDVCANSGVAKLDKGCDIEVYDNIGNIVWKCAKDLVAGDIIPVYDDELNSTTTYSIACIKDYDTYIILQYS